VKNTRLIKYRHIIERIVYGIIALVSIVYSPLLLIKEVNEDNHKLTILTCFMMILSLISITLFVVSFKVRCLKYYVNNKIFYLCIEYFVDHLILTDKVIYRSIALGLSIPPMSYEEEGVKIKVFLDPN